MNGISNGHNHNTDKFLLTSGLAFLEHDEDGEATIHR